MYSGVKIYNTDSVEVMAKKIYNFFEVGQSCTVYGFVVNELIKKVTPKGELVVDYIKSLYEIDCMRIISGRVKRAFLYKKNSVGGPVAHKIFIWDKKIVDSEPRYTIWRFQ